MSLTEAAAEMKLNGLVLSGGRSLRMGSDKGALIYPPHTVDQRTRCYELLKTVCEDVYISIRPDQSTYAPGHLPTLLDSVSGEGPGAGILSANEQIPNQAWFILACDFPHLDAQTLQTLVQQRDPSRAATVTVHADERIEPLLSIWEPKALEAFTKNYAQGDFGPRFTLESLNIVRVLGSSPRILFNANSPF